MQVKNYIETITRNFEANPYKQCKQVIENTEKHWVNGIVCKYKIKSSGPSETFCIYEPF